MPSRSSPAWPRRDGWSPSKLTNICTTTSWPCTRSTPRSDRSPRSAGRGPLPRAGWNIIESGCTWSTLPARGPERPGLYDEFYNEFRRVDLLPGPRLAARPLENSSFLVSSAPPRMPVPPRRPLCRPPQRRHASSLDGDDGRPPALFPPRWRDCAWPSAGAAAGCSTPRTSSTLASSATPVTIHNPHGSIPGATKALPTRRTGRAAPPRPTAALPLLSLRAKRSNLLLPVWRLLQSLRSFAMTTLRRPYPAGKQIRFPAESSLPPTPPWSAPGK